MMEILYIIIGLLIGIVLGFLYANIKKKTTIQELLLLQQKLQQETAAKLQVEEAKKQLEKDKTDLQQQVMQIKLNLQQVSTQLDAEKQMHTKEEQMRSQQFQQQLKTVQEQFSNLATRILSETSERLKSTNTESITHITEPLKNNMKQLEEAIQRANSNTTESTASLKVQLQKMSEQTENIANSAIRLTNVIRGGNKAQGIWGERMLTDILDSQGYKIGIDYDIQNAIVDEKGNVVKNEDSGKRMIPDVILHYPNNEDVIIDAKMSIDAYYQYANTEEEELKKKFATDLVRSIRTQATNLAKKDYSKYVQSPRKAIDFVIMFVPNEGALQLALTTEPKLWAEAFDKHVFITSQQNLMAILRIIQITWRQYAQTENQKKVFDLAEELLKRVGEFIKRFDKVGKDIDNLHKDYGDAYNKAYTGRQSIVQKANELKDLGVKESINQPIPVVEADITNMIEDVESTSKCKIIKRV